MKNEKFRDALDHIDYSFIEEYVEEKERLQKENRRKRLFKQESKAFLLIFESSERARIVLVSNYII